MSDNMYQLLAIVIYMIAMLAIGWYAFVKTSNLTDYMLGGRSLGPAVTALSAGVCGYVWLAPNGLTRCDIFIRSCGGLDCNWINNRSLPKLATCGTTFTGIYTGYK